MTSSKLAFAISDNENDNTYTLSYKMTSCHTIMNFKFFRVLDCRDMKFKKYEAPWIEKFKFKYKD